MKPPRCSISVIIPAYNEESYIGPTVEFVKEAKAIVEQRDAVDVDIIVVDNGSTDRTAEIARSHGARVVEESRGNVAIARNAGASAARNEILVFVDADTHWPRSLLCRVVDVMSDDRYVGGAVDTEYRPKRLVVQAYVRFWRVFGRLFRMAQGATQFCRASVFESIGGYDERVFMGEDVDFYWRLRQFARKQTAVVHLIDDVKVVPSCRRLDKWPFWKTLALTNPLTCFVFSRSKKPWGSWYGRPTR